MSKVVAVSATRRTDAGRERVALNTAYVQALTRAGLVPVIVAPILDPETACAVLDRVQGLVLTGGEDVAPARYHAPPHPKLGETDAGRDAVEVALIAGARARRLPTLAICRGIQILNVALGGTLVQDVSLVDEWRSHPTDPGWELWREVQRASLEGEEDVPEHPRHRIAIEPGSRLHEALGETEIEVDSFHHQALDQVAPELRDGPSVSEHYPTY